MIASRNESAAPPLPGWPEELTALSFSDLYGRRIHLSSARINDFFMLGLEIVGCAENAYGRSVSMGDIYCWRTSARGGRFRLNLLVKGLDRGKGREWREDKGKLANGTF